MWPNEIFTHGIKVKHQMTSDALFIFQKKKKIPTVVPTYPLQFSLLFYLIIISMRKNLKKRKWWVLYIAFCNPHFIYFCMYIMLLRYFCIFFRWNLLLQGYDMKLKMEENQVHKELTRRKLHKHNTRSYKNWIQS